MSSMQIKEITQNKNNFMDILLIGDEEQSMIEKYLALGRLFVLYSSNIPVSVCVVQQIDESIAEIKNLATYPEQQNKGYATELLNFVFKKYKDKAQCIILGTGENPKTLNFYKKKGFMVTHRIKNFFTENYSHPIYENGVQLVDMIYMKKYLI